MRLRPRRGGDLAGGDRGRGRGRRNRGRGSRGDRVGRGGSHRGRRLGRVLRLSGLRAGWTGEGGVRGAGRFAPLVPTIRAAPPPALPAPFPRNRGKGAGG